MPDTTNITDFDKGFMRLLQQGGAQETCLFSAFYRGRPTCLICAVSETDDGIMKISPVYMRILPDMFSKIADHDGLVPANQSHGPNTH